MAAACLLELSTKINFYATDFEERKKKRTETVCTVNEYSRLSL